MIEVKGKITNHLVAILIDLGEIHSYINPNIVGKFLLKRNKLEKLWSV